MKKVLLAKHYSLDFEIHNIYYSVLKCRVLQVFWQSKLF